jgi:deoxyribonuclease-4
MSEPSSAIEDVQSRLLGAHMPTAGGLSNSLTGGKAIGCTAVQLFTGSPRQWHHPPLDPEVAAKFRQTQAETGIAVAVAHDSYLINLAAPDPDILDRSRKAFRRELDRSEMLGLPWVVTHMGAHLDSGEEAGIALLIESTRAILEETEGMQVGIAMETTAGQGTGLGYRFEQIARVLEGAGAHPRLGVCLDTCHIFVAGYDIRDEESYQKTFAEFDRLIGLDRLKVIHANDAKKPLGSRVDRHEHLGEGEIGIETFRLLVTDPRLKNIPIIIETPESETMHAVNLAKLKRLSAGGSLGMRVTVRFFGHYSDFSPDGMEVSVPGGATVASLSAILAEKDGRLAGIERHCRAAVNEEYVAPDAVLQEGDEVAFIPPMSGG